MFIAVVLRNGPRDGQTTIIDTDLVNTVLYVDDDAYRVSREIVAIDGIEHVMCEYLWTESPC